MGKREPPIILKTDERSAVLELGLGVNSLQNQRAGTKTRSSSKGTCWRPRSRTGPGAHPHAGEAAAARAGAPLLRVTLQQAPATALRCAATRCVAPSPVAVEAGNGVADEEAERLGGASRQTASGGHP